MNKKALPVIIILLLLVLGLGVVLVMSKKSSPSVSENTVVQTPAVAQKTETTEQPAQETLKSLLTGGKSQKCTFSNTTDATTVNGTVYIAKGKIREDFKSTAAGVETNTHVIVDSTYSYMWTENSQQGFKFPITQEPTATSSPSQSSQSVDLDQMLNYTCSGWTEDDSLFKLPANVTFQSFTVPSLPPTGSASGSADQCSVCDDLPAGDAQDTCKTQLHCQ